MQLFVLERAADRGCLSVDWLAFFPEIRRVRGGKSHQKGECTLFVTARASNVTARPARHVCFGEAALTVDLCAVNCLLGKQQEIPRVRRGKGRYRSQASQGITGVPRGSRRMDQEQVRRGVRGHDCPGEGCRGLCPLSHLFTLCFSLPFSLSFSLSLSNFPISFPLSLFLSPFPSLSFPLFPSLLFLLSSSPSPFSPLPLSLSPPPLSLFSLFHFSPLSDEQNLGRQIAVQRVSG